MHQQQEGTMWQRRKQKKLFLTKSPLPTVALAIFTGLIVVMMMIITPSAPVLVVFVLADNIQGTAGDDTLNGTPEADTINGFEGNDLIFGEGGDDTLDGGKGDDDEIHGGDGNDAFTFPFMAQIIKFACLTGLRPAEVVDSVRLINDKEALHKLKQEIESKG
jgi:hypothetical protein